MKVWEASYLPFGGVHASTGGIDLRFPGQWFQLESGLHQNWMRDYDPTTGRYIQADPLGLVDGASVYGYALQNPGRYTDLRGEEAEVFVNGNHVTINIPLAIKCDCTEEEKQNVRNRIQAALTKYWSGNFGRFTVVTTLTEIDSSECCGGNTLRYNEVTEHQTSQIITNPFTKRVMGGRIDSLDTLRTLAHECGHIMGLYGHDYPHGTIMNSGHHATESMIERIIKWNTR